VITWTECPPERARIDAAGLSRAVELAAARGSRAQLCVLRDGEVVLDRSFGCGPEALFWTFSAGKPFAALLVHLLAERGQLRLDDPVADYWPGFAHRGKESITIRQVLAHRAGLPVARGQLPDALAITSWERSVRLLERARPRIAPGQAPAYHTLTYGFLLGELVRRVTDMPVDEFLAGELLAPWALHDTHLGLPAGLLPRRIPVHGRGALARATALAVNRAALRRAVIPAGGLSSTARDLARFYQGLLAGGVLDGVRLLQATTIAQASQPSSDGETDQVAKLPIRWSYGFQLGGPPADRIVPHSMGQHSSPETFGHNGSNTCLGWADPTRQLVMVYLSDLLTLPRHDGAAHCSALSDALLTACR
jgi:CubicO group peptidase (beta-lactamase class C family)